MAVAAGREVDERDARGVRGLVVPGDEHDAAVRPRPRCPADTRPSCGCPRRPSGSRRAGRGRGGRPTARRRRARTGGSGGRGRRARRPARLVASPAARGAVALEAQAEGRGVDRAQARARVGWWPRARCCQGARVALPVVSIAAALPIRRNTALLAAALAANSGMLQLSAAVASLTLVAVLGVKGLLGLGPAIVLASGALAALPAGRAMDRFGRVPVLAAGFIVGAGGCGLAALGSALPSAPAVLARARGWSAPRAGPRCWRARRRETCTRPSGARTASRSCCSGRSSARSSARSCSARCSPAATSTATRSPGCGWPRAASCSPASCSCSPSGPTRCGSPSCCAPTRRGRARRRRRRCARSCAARARSRRCSPARPRSP